jgi:hypothetical protein
MNNPWVLDSNHSGPEPNESLCVIRWLAGERGLVAVALEPPFDIFEKVANHAVAERLIFPQKFQQSCRHSFLSSFRRFSHKRLDVCVERSSINQPNST